VPPRGIVAPRMIVQSRTWASSLFAVRGTSLRRIWTRVGVTVLVAIITTILHIKYDMLEHNLTTLPFTLVGLPLGIFLGFRNTSSYDRFWEGRRLWGGVINTSRSLTRQILDLIGPGPGQSSPLDEAQLTSLHRALVYRVIAYVHMLRAHLRDETIPEVVDELMPAAEVDRLSQEINRPVAILQTLGDQFRDAWRQGIVHAVHLPLLEQSLMEFTNLQGACERIKSTPLPFSYTVLIHRLVASYAMSLPFGIVDTVGVFTPVVVLLISYAFYGLDALGDELENPFGTDNNDLPLATLSRMIEVNLRQRLGETDLPPLLVPVDGVSL